MPKRFHVILTKKYILSRISINRKRDLEYQLSNLHDKKTKGAQIRSRAKWVQEG